VEDGFLHGVILSDLLCLPAPPHQGRRCPRELKVTRAWAGDIYQAVTVNVSNLKFDLFLRSAHTPNERAVGAASRVVLPYVNLRHDTCRSVATEEVL
jgi:hypothetical protein